MYHSILYTYHAKQAKQAKQAEPPKKEKDKKKGTTAATEMEVHNELITPELHKESYQSVSKNLGQKILTDALGAMHSSMVTIKCVYQLHVDLAQ